MQNPFRNAVRKGEYYVLSEVGNGESYVATVTVSYRSLQTQMGYVRRARGP